MKDLTLLTLIFFWNKYRTRFVYYEGVWKAEVEIISDQHTAEVRD